ncbi:MAG TPA: GNAT family N-acetyltransferase [Phototrophicaceae bacterium]|nr:GNAT family N-acetyltransferase [Phototrophicaceae bacterium]
MPTYAFRRLNEDDFDSAYAILVEVTDWLLSKGVRQWMQPIPRDLYAQRQLEGENYGLLINDALAAVISLLHLRPDYWADELPNEDSYRWMATLASSRQFKGQKLGELILSEAEQFLINEGVPALYLDCIYGQGALPEFYTSLGYRQIARKNIEFPHGTFDSVLMRKKLYR